ncbi:MAG TPA: S8 family serine peptidase [Candidatus Eisenbacteria bacterium]
MSQTDGPGPASRPGSPRFGLPHAALLLLAAAWLAAAASALAKPPSLSPALGSVRPGEALSERFLARDAAGRTFADIFIDGDVPAGLLRAQGIEVNTVAGGLMTARCPLDRLSALLATPGVRRLEVAERCRPLLDQSIPDVDASSVRTVPPPSFTGQTGAGVLVGIVDSGIDWSHDDFKHPDGTTRLVAIWDQTSATGPAPPGFTYGREWSASQINAGSCTETDTDGHGTHVMGIIAGDGSATGNGLPPYQYVGVAPEADLCVVKTTFASSNIVDGVSYIFQKAAALGKQAVVNLSLGTQAGPHDGTADMDIMLNALTGPGRILSASAGNTGLDNLHGKVFVTPSLSQAMTLSVPTYTRNPGTSNDYLIFSGWYEGSDAVSLTIRTPRGTTLGPVAPGAQLLGQNTTDGYLNIYNGTTAPSNGDNEIYIELFDAVSTRPPRSGTWTFTFSPVSIASTGRVDMYLYGDLLGDGSQLAMWVQGLDPEGVVGSPGDADSIIATAAHATKDCWDSVDGNSYCWNPAPPLNAIADFSSHGPRRDGALKPDISAPGFGVTSTKSASYAADPALVATDGVHVNLPGTSMSSPHVAGTAALLLAQPAWSGSTPSQVKMRLQSTARSDAFTGTVPNMTWGFGKLDVALALAPLLTVQVPYPPKGAYLPPGKPDSVTVMTGNLTADSILVDLSLDGGGTYPIPLGTLYGVVPGTPTALSFFVAESLVTTQARVRATATAGAATVTAYSDSVFLIQAPVAVALEPSASAPRFALLPNSPNPFNPTTTIRFEVDRAGRTSLRIYDPRGRLVRALVNEALPAGRYRTVWDGTDDRGTAVASGVYLYAISSGGKNLTRKMTLLK